MLLPTYLLDKTLLNTISVSLDINNRKKNLLGAVFMCLDFIKIRAVSQNQRAEVVVE